MNASSCGFKSRHPHQKRHVYRAVFLLRSDLAIENKAVRFFRSAVELFPISFVCDIMATVNDGDLGKVAFS